jgi:hypothetical protein
MTASGYGAVDKVSKTGDTSTGPQVFDGNPPIQIPSGAANGKVLTSDSSGNATWQSASATAGLAWYNVKSYGAVGNGTHDDTSAVQSAVTAATASNGGVVYLPYGSYLISTPLAVTSALGVTLRGDGTGASYITMSASFSGAAAVIITGGNSCRVESLTVQGHSTTYSSNPSAAGIQMLHTNTPRLDDLLVAYTNGWGVVVQSDATGDTTYPQLSDVHTYNCAMGIQLVGTNSSDHQMGAFLSDIMIDGCQAGDGLQILDVYDVQLGDFDSSLNTGSVIHIKGTGGDHTLNNLDLGTVSTTVPALLIESGGLGSPSNIAISNSILQYGKAAVQITAGTRIMLSSCAIQQGNTYGLNISGSVDGLTVTGCVFSQNGVTAGAANYDLNWSATGNVVITSSVFESNIGTSANEVAAGMNFTAGTSAVVACMFPQGTAYNNDPTFPAANVGDTFTNLQHVFATQMQTYPSSNGIGVGQAAPGSDGLAVAGPASLNDGLAMNATKITGLANGSAASDGAAFGQIPTTGNVTAQTSFGASSGNGSASTVSHSDHTHGTPALDTTATDIKPDGTQSAGSTLKAADAGHVHPFNSVSVFNPATISTAETLIVALPVKSANAKAGSTYVARVVGMWTNTSATGSIVWNIRAGTTGTTASDQLVATWAHTSGAANTGNLVQFDITFTLTGTGATAQITGTITSILAVGSVGYAGNAVTIQAFGGSTGWNTSTATFLDLSFGTGVATSTLAIQSAYMQQVA